MLRQRFDASLRSGRPGLLPGRHDLRVDHQKEVRKLAFFREPAPSVFAVPIRLMRKLVDKSGLRRLTRGEPGRAAPVMTEVSEAG